MTQPSSPSPPGPNDPSSPHPGGELHAFELAPAGDSAGGPPPETMFLQEGDDLPPAAAPVRRWRWVRWTLGLGFLFLLLGAALLPEFVSQPPWTNRIAAMALPNLKGRLEIGTLSCGWFSPLALHDVRLFDAQGKRLAQVSKIVFEKPLWSIAWSPRKLGKIRVVRPEAVVEVEGKTSNWDDLFAVPPPKEPPAEAAAPQPAPEWGLEMEGGAALVTIKKPGELPKTMHFDDWKASVSPEGGGNVPFEASGEYREGAYKFELQGRMNPTKKTWEVVVLKAGSPEHPWGCDLTGTFANAAPYPLRLGGDVRYDLSALADLLRPTVGPSLQLSGGRQSQLSAEASLAPLTGGDPAAAVRALLKEAKATAHLPIEHLQYQGVSVNQLDLAARLGQGKVSFDLVADKVNQGRVQLRTVVDLAESRKLTVAPGEIVRRVQMTPDVCSGAMRLVAPILADSARASGEFSLSLDDCEIPLDSPKLSRISGRLSIHSVQVGANDLVRKLAETLKLPGEIRLIDESVVEFSVQGEAVLHDGLEFVLGPVRIRSHGEVKFDESIQLLLQIQLPSDWKDSRPVLRALAGKTIQVPVGGTLRKPQLMVEEAVKGNLVSLIRGLANPADLDGVSQGLGLGGTDPATGGSGLERLLLGDDATPGVVDVVGDLLRRRNEPRPPAPNGSADPAAAPPPPAGAAPPRRWLNGDRLRRMFGGSGAAAPPPPSPSPRAAPSTRQPAPPSPAPPPPLPDGGREF